MVTQPPPRLPAPWQWASRLLLQSPRRQVSRSIAFTKQHAALHAMVTNAGVESRSAPGYDWHGLRRGSARFALLQYTLAGEGQLRFESQTMALHPGQVMLLYMPHDHRYWVQPDRCWTFFYLCLNGSEVLRAWHSAVTRLGPVITLAHNTALVRSASALCRAAVEGDLTSPWDASSRAYDLAMRLRELALPMDPSHRREPRPSAVQRAIDYCQTRLHQPISVGQLAEVAGYSRFHFTRLFEKSEGLSPGEYVLRQRLSLAMQQVQTTHDPVKVIARQCGFHDTAYFCKAFRRQYGSSPGSLRKSGMYG